MGKQKLSVEWLTWIELNKEQGCNLMDMLNIIVNGGNDVYASFEAIFNETPKIYNNKNWYNYQQNQIILDEQKIDILLYQQSPEIVLFNNFLSDEECDILVELSQSRLMPAEVFNAFDGKKVQHLGRTSLNTFFTLDETPLISKIDNRISDLLEIPQYHGEGLQVMKYLEQGEYKTHYDYFSIKNAEALRLRKGGQRIGTFIMYLNDVDVGGETHFPILDLKIIPKKGNALFFSYTNENSEVDERTIHSGNPVLRGNKWIATKWFHEYPFN